ncbi:sugar ABC transporter permease, partial [Tateyamaria sp.]|nr:sugar ABC transporter permease [Tateyamaria sp.]
MSDAVHQPQAEPSWLSRNKLAISPWVFLIPALFFFAIYVVIPIFASLRLSLYEWNGLYDASGNSTATWVG